VAEEEGEFVSYLGEAALSGEATGTYLAPNGSLESTEKLLNVLIICKEKLCL